METNISKFLVNSLFAVSSWTYSADGSLVQFEFDIDNIMMIIIVVKI
ncbi:MAG: hypothetical protein H6609_19510 [Ignavibacteriales bacterium]|nr:hypothetical protein [Ignavibacteriales bacterium]